MPGFVLAVLKVFGCKCHHSALRYGSPAESFLTVATLMLLPKFHYGQRSVIF